MATLAIVGAGRGLGAAVARRFGREGFAIALVSRDQAKLDGMAAELADGGVTARGYSADVRDAASLEAALTSAADDLGPITVLQYSPLPSRSYLEPVLDLTAELALEALRFSALGLIAAALAFAASFGIGVMLSAASVLVVQGALTVVGVLLGDLVPDAHISALTATGGLMLAGIAFRLLRIRDIPVGDMLPALIVAPLLTQVVIWLR